MSEFKKGDRVLYSTVVTEEANDAGAIRIRAAMEEGGEEREILCWPGSTPFAVQPDPGVPVTDLLRIAELVDITSDTVGTSNDWHELQVLLERVRAIRRGPS